MTARDPSTLPETRSRAGWCSNLLLHLPLLLAACEWSSGHTPKLTRISQPMPTRPTPKPVSGADILTLDSGHAHAVISVAVSRDGRLLATGSEADPETDDIEQHQVGVVVWDVESGTRRVAVPVVGGVGLGDQLRRGLQFSPDGSLLGFNFSTNQVGVLDVATGNVVLEASASYNDSAPSFALADDAIFVGACEGQDDVIGSIAPARGGSDPVLRGVTVAGGTGYSDALSFRGGIIHAVYKEQLVSVNRGRVVRMEPLLRHHRPGLDAIYTVAPSPSGRFVAASAADPRCGRPALVGSALIDVDTGTRIYEDSALTNVLAFAFDSGETRWAALVGVGNPGAPARHASIFERGRLLGTIAGPFEARDWQRFADGVPFAFAPDGRHALVLRPGGLIERWTIDPHPALAGSVGKAAHAKGVLWPLPDMAIAVGPRVLVFLRPSNGEVVQRHVFRP